jgi:YidC/Oxa1 family membrane protein insertase
MNILIAPFINALIGFYHLFGSFGWAVIAVTVLIRILLIPLVLPTLKSSKKMMQLQPKLKKIQEEHKGDKKALAAAQMELYKREGINPLSGCLPQILQIAVLIIFFSAFNMVVNYSMGKGNLEAVNRNLIPAFQLKADHQMNLMFWGSDLRQAPGAISKQGWGLNMVLPLFLLLGSAVLQFFSSKLMMPSTKTDQKVLEKATKDKEDDMMGAMRTQSLYMMPAMTIFLGWSFNLGILLYWFMNSLVMYLQQLMVEKKK